MFSPTKTREQVLSLLEPTAPEPPALDRTAKEREAYRWLLTRARDLKVTRNDSAHKFMEQILRERRPALEDAYHDTSDDEFLQALRHWTAAGLKALRCGIEAEDELLERDGRVRSEGQAFRLAAGIQTPKGPPRPDSEARERA